MSMERVNRSASSIATSDDPPGHEGAARIEARKEADDRLRARTARLRHAISRERLLELRETLARIDLNRPRRVVVAWWRVVRRWLLANTFSPAWVPHRWDMPRVAYALAVLVQVVTVLITLVVIHIFPAFVYPDPFVILTVVLVALNWGAAPGLIASIVGAFLLNELVAPHFLPSSLHWGGTPSAMVVALIGVVISLATSRTERARRRAEDLAVDTERARLETEALRARLDAVIEAMADGVMVYDNAENLLRINRTGRELLDLDEQAADFAARPAGERLEALGLLDEQGHPFAPEQAPLAQILRGEVLTGTDAVDLVRHTRGGREMLLNLSGAPIRNTSGYIVGAVAILRDVTERRRLERRTQDALNALLAMAEALVLAPEETKGAETQSPESSDASSAGGVAQRLAALTRNLLGCQRVGILSLDPETELLHPLAIASCSGEQGWDEQPSGMRLGDIAEPPLVARLRGGQMALLDLRERPRGGLRDPYGPITLLVAPMRLDQTLIGVLTLDHGGAAHVYTPEETALAGAVAELTALVIERERLLHERAEARARELALSESTRRMNEFLAIASHELKTPLTVIKTNIQVLTRRLSGHSGADPVAEEPDRVLEQATLLFQRVERQTDRLNRLVEDLLDVTRIHAGKLEMRPVPCDLAAVVEDSTEELRQAHATRMLVFDHPSAVAVPVVADPERIGQVVTNYVTNALKYSREDRPVRVRIAVEGPRARVTVHDEGPGIPPEEQPRVWDRFHRVSGIDVQTGSGVGLGLGLHISRTIVERHAGEVGVESTMGAGSTFWFALPLAREGADE